MLGGEAGDQRADRLGLAVRPRTGPLPRAVAQHRRLADLPARRALDQLNPERRLEFERELVGRAAAPLHAAQDLDQATGTFRAQATSFRAASATFGQLAGLMDQQADLLERAGTLMRDGLVSASQGCDSERFESSDAHAVSCFV